MKTVFLPKLVNGQAGDPVVYVDILREKRAILLDCGLLDALSPSEIIRISDVFVSHMHIDHFIGFEHLLRLKLGRGQRIRIHGPEGITDCVHGKLRGYTWNLVNRQRLVFEVREFDGKTVKTTDFFCRQRFKQAHARGRQRTNVLLADERLTVKAAVLDHRIPCLAFMVKEQDFLNVNPVKLTGMGFRPGPWLNQLKAQVRKGLDEDSGVDIDGEFFPSKPLADALLIRTQGRKIGYVSDVLGNPENRSAIHKLLQGVDFLFCEGAFLHEDLKRARETYHLTARQAGEIAGLTGAKQLIIFHFSPKYDGRFSDLENEAKIAFGP
jgi:ribonuclease Z